MGLRIAGNDKFNAEQEKREQATIDEMRQRAMRDVQHQTMHIEQDIASEVHNIENDLQIQIDDNRKAIAESKITENKLSKRSWWQFGISLFVSIVSTATAVIALIISLLRANF